MRYSLAEIDAVSKKAARGAGFTWGLSEEAGKAVRYLASLSLPGPRLLANFLRQLDKGEINTGRPTCINETWRSENGCLCPLATGALLSDSISQFEQTKSVYMGPSVAPLLTAAVVSRSVAMINQALQFEWQNTVLLLDQDGLSVEGCEQDIARLLVDAMSVTAVPRPSQVQQIKAEPCTVDDATWGQLNELAFRTYVPSSEASRAGAGSQLSDND